MMDGNSESEVLKGTERCREEKLETLASPEEEQGSSEKKKKKKRRSRKKKKINEKRAEQNEHPQVCPQPEPLVATPIPSEPKPDEEAPLPDPKDTPQGAQPQPQPQPEEPSNAEHPELKKKKRVKKKKKKEKGEEPNEHLGVCLDPPLDMAIPTNLEKKKEAQPEPGPGSPTAPICPKPVIPIDQTIPVDPALSECPKAAPPTGQTIPVDPAIPIDAEQNANKKNRKRKRRKSVVDAAQPNEHDIKSTCHIAAAPIGATFPMEAHPAIPISVAIPADPDHNTSEKKRKRIRKRKSGLKSDGENPNEHNGKPPEIDPTIPIGQTIPIDNATSKDQMIPIGQTIPIDPIAAPSIDPTIPIDPIAAPSIDPTIPIDQTIPIDATIPMEAHPAIPISVAIPADPDHNTSEKKRKRTRKRKSGLKSEGENPIEHNGKPPEIDPTILIGQTILKDTATSRDQMIPIGQMIPIDPATSKDQMIPIGQTIPVDPIAAPSIDPTIPIDQTIPIDPALSKCQCPEPAPPTSQTIQVDAAIPIDTEQKPKKRKRKKRKSVVDGAQPNEHNTTSTCHIAAAPIDATILMEAHPAIPISVAIPADPDHNTSEKKRKRTRKRKSGLKSDGENPNEHNGKPPEIDPTILIGQTIPIDPALSKCPEAAPPTGQTIPVDTAIPIDAEQKAKKRKRKKRKSVVDGAQPNEHNTTSTCHIAAAPIDPTIPMEAHPAIPISVAIPADPDHNTSEKKRKIDLKSEGENPNEHNGKPPEAPVQIPINPIAAPSIDPTIPIDQTIPIGPGQRINPATSKDPGQRINPATSKDPGQPIDPATSKDPGQKMTDKKWKKKGMSALKSEGSESNQHNADPTAEAPAQGTKGVLVTRAPNICQACRKPGHKYTQCPRLKNLSKDEEICFFCGEIGHSLGKCSVSLAGGGRFAKCLFCHAHGHFTYNCPGNGQGIDPKVVAANGPINKSCA